MKRLIIGALIATHILMGQTYYDLVEVSPSAAESEINSACRKAMFKYHPDKNRNNPQAEEKFKEINNACEVLRDNTKRAAYDAALEAGTPNSGANRGNTLAIEGPASSEAEDKSPEGWLNKIKTKVQGAASGKEEKIVTILGTGLEFISKYIPDQSKTIFNQNLALKDIGFTKTVPKGANIKTGIGFSGSMKFNEFTVKGTVYAFLDKSNGKQVSVEVEVPENYSLNQMFPTVIKKDSVIDKLKMPKGRFIASSVDYTATNNWKVLTGFNFVAELDLKFLTTIQDFINTKGKVQGLIFEGGQAMIGAKFPTDLQKMELEGAIPIKLGVDFTKIPKAQAVAKIFKTITTDQFTVSAKPAETQLDAEGKTVIILTTQPEKPLEIVLSTAVRAKAPQVMMAGSFDGMVDLASWISLGNFGLQIEIDEAVLPETLLVGIPFTGIGMRGQIDLGKGDKRAQLNAAAKLSLKASGAIPDAVYDLEGKNLHLSDFIIFMSQVAEKVIKRSVSIPSDKMPQVVINDLTGYLSITDTKIGTTEYKRGIKINADAEIMKQKFALGFFLDPNPKNVKVGGKGYLSPIEKKVIVITGAGCPNDPDKKPGACVEFSFEAMDPSKGMLYLDGELRLPTLDVSSSAHIEFKSNKFNAAFSTKIQDFFSAGFNVAMNADDAEDFDAGFKFEGDFARFMNELLLPELQSLNSQATEKAAEADRKWLEWTAKVREHQADVQKYREKVANLQGKLEQAKQLMAMFTNAETERKKCEEKVQACKSAGIGVDKLKKCVGVAFNTNCYTVAAKAVGRAITNAEFDAAKGVLSGYDQAVKQYEAATKAFEEANRYAAEANGLRELTKATVGTFTKLVELVSKGVMIVNLKQAAGEFKGKELKNGKLPKLIILELDINIPQGVPKVGGKTKTLTLKDLQFDFQKPKDSLKSVAKSLANSIKDLVK